VLRESYYSGPTGTCSLGPRRGHEDGKNNEGQWMGTPSPPPSPHARNVLLPTKRATGLPSHRMDLQESDSPCSERSSHHPLFDDLPSDGSSATRVHHLTFHMGTRATAAARRIYLPSPIPEGPNSGRLGITTTIRYHN
jgi:hypothetical protein